MDLITTLNLATDNTNEGAAEWSLVVQHCMSALLRKVDSVWCKELGRWIGRRSSPMEQTPQPGYQGRGGKKSLEVQAVKILRA